MPPAIRFCAIEKVRIPGSLLCNARKLYYAIRYIRKRWGTYASSRPEELMAFRIFFQ